MGLEYDSRPRAPMELLTGLKPEKKKLKKDMYHGYFEFRASVPEIGHGL